jgi:tetratricopeptide (TPR) repeat protein
MRAKTKKRLVILLAATVLLAAALVAAYVVNQSIVESRTEQFLKDGLAAVAADNPTQVLHNLGTYILRTDTRDPDVLIKYADARAAVEMPGRQHLADAIKVYRLVLDIDPAREEAKRALLDLYWRVGRSLESIEIADEYLAKDANDSAALWVRAVSLHRLRRYDEAFLAAERFAVAADNDYAYFMMLEIMQQRDDKPDQILACAMDLHKRHPDDPRFELLVGYAYTLIDDRENAEIWLRRYAAREVQNVGMMRILIAQLDRLSMYDEALELLTKAAHVGGGVEVRRDLVRRLWESDDLEQVLRELVDVAPDAEASDPDLMAFKALALLQTGEREQALGYIDAIEGIHTKASARAWAIFLRETVMPDVDAQRLATVCHNALQHDQWNTAIRFSLGVAYEMLGESELAIEQWQRCKNERPSWHQPLVRMARVYTNTGRPRQAVEAAGEAAARAPNDAETVIEWIVAMSSDMDRLSRKEADELLEVIEQIQSAVPGEPQTLAIRIETLSRFGGKAAAVAALRAALDYDPPLDAATYLALADISTRQGLGLEQTCFEKARRHHGMSADLALAMAVATYESGDADAGRRLILEAHAAAPEPQRITYRLAEARYLDLIHHDDALSVWSALADANPDNIVVQRQLLAAWAVQRDRQLLDRTIERIKALTGDTGITWRLARARFLLDSQEQQRDAALAASLLNDVIRMAPTRVEPQLMLAEAMDRLNNPTGAIARLIAAADLNPDTPEIALELADRLIRLRNDPERARLYLERVLTSPTATSEHRRHAAGVLVQLGEVDRAVALLESDGRIAGEPDLLYAMLCWRQGRFDDVAAMCEKMLAEPTADRIAFVADFYASTQRTDEATAALAQLDAALVTPVERELVLASFHRAHGTLDDAVTHYRRALEASSRHEDAWLAYLELLILSGPASQIAAALDEAGRALPDHAGVAAIKAQWPRLASFGENLPDMIRPVTVSLLVDQASRDAAMQTLQLLVSAERDARPLADVVFDLKSLANRHPLYAPVQSLAVRYALKAGQLEDAVNIATRAAKAFAADSEMAWLACEALASMNRWSEVLVAAQDWRRRVYQNPLPADQMIAEARLNMRDPARAVTQLEPYMTDALKQPDAFASVIHQYARALVAARQPSKARAMLQPLAAASPMWRETWIALTEEPAVDQAMAAQWLNEIASLMPDDSTDERLHLASGWFAHAQRFNLAASRARVVDIVAPLASRDDAPAETSLLLAYCAEIDGDHSAAERHYREAIRRDPSQDTACNNLAMLLLNQKRQLDEAVALAGRAVKSQPDNPVFLHTLAAVLAGKREYDGAIEAIRRAARLEPQSIEWTLTLGELLVEAGRKDQAVAPLVEIDQLIDRGAPVDGHQRQRIQRLRQTVTPTGSAAVSRGSLENW